MNCKVDKDGIEKDFKQMGYEGLHEAAASHVPNGSTECVIKDFVSDNQVNLRVN
jgi:hypothetical protein